MVIDSGLRLAELAFVLQPVPGRQLLLVETLGRVSLRGPVIVPRAQKAAATVLATGHRARVALNAQHSRVDPAIHRCHVRNPASAIRIPQFIHQSVDGCDVWRPEAVQLLLLEVRVTHPPMCHLSMIPRCPFTTAWQLVLVQAFLRATWPIDLIPY